jgi:CRP-like cAMP-binding protein
MVTTAILPCLAQTSLFAGVPMDVLADVAGKLSYHQYQPGEMIVWQGEPSSMVYVITRGIATVTRLVPGSQRATTLACLMPQQSFGEIGILEGRPRAASVVALTAVEVVALQQQDFLDLLHSYASVAIALARTLGHHLVDANRRQAQRTIPSRLIVLYSVGHGAASSGLGHALAMALLHTREQPTVYLEYLEAHQRAGPAGIDPATCTYRHAAGYDVFIPHEERALPPVVRTTLTLDHLMGQYRHVIMMVSDMTDASVPVLLEQATHLVVVAPPTP